ncbi:MAG: peptidoglycan DD-metalloendopeptidase family protein [Pseudomonadota bacterium]
MRASVNRLERRSKRFRRLHFCVGVLLAASAIVAGMTILDDSPSESASVSIQITLPENRSAAPDPELAPVLSSSIPNSKIEYAEPSAPNPPPPLEENGLRWRSVTVASGDNLSLIFSRVGLSPRDLANMVDNKKLRKYLRKIKPGQLIRFGSEDDILAEMILEIDEFNSLRIARTGEGNFNGAIETIEPEVVLAEAGAKITRSLFLDGQDAGLSDSMILKMTEVFGWDIDFALDLRKGDHFSLVYEEILKDGAKVKDGRLIAAMFVNQGQTHQAILYELDDGKADYFSEKGAAMRKAFLRTPVNFTRISSRFNLRRKHPILNTIRAHRGVDYAAPYGTPIRATADGKVKFAGNNGGYGRTIELAHGETYGTLYAHLARFAGGLRKGKTVRQGQTIGYVGKSGLATGPHLHYEFRVNGRHRDPLRVKLPKSDPIPERHLADYLAHAEPWLKRLNDLSARVLADDTMLARIELGP